VFALPAAINTTNAADIKDAAEAVLAQVAASAGADADVTVFVAAKEAVTVAVAGFSTMSTADKEATVDVIGTAACGGRTAPACTFTTPTAAARHLRSLGADDVDVTVVNIVAADAELPAPVAADALTSSMTAGFAAATFEGTKPDADAVGAPTIAAPEVQFQVAVVAKAGKTITPPSVDEVMTQASAGFADAGVTVTDADLKALVTDSDCEFSFSTCSAACVRTYTVEAAAVGKGAACAHADDAEVACSAGTGDCPEDEDEVTPTTDVAAASTQQVSLVATALALGIMFA